jgi:hypothetical protein
MDTSQKSDLDESGRRASRHFRTLEEELAILKEADACAGPCRTRFRTDGGHGSGGMTDTVPVRGRTVSGSSGMLSAMPGSLSGMGPEREP